MGIKRRQLLLKIQTNSKITQEEFCQPTKINVTMFKTNCHPFLAVVLICSILSGNCLNCDDPSERSANICADLLDDLEIALLRDQGNLHRMKEAFFYSPTASPVLLKVVYNITYGQNIKTAIAKEEVLHCNNSSQFEEKHLTGDRHCSSSTGSSLDKHENACALSGSIPTPALELKQRSYIYGWTSTGVYTVFHPIALHMMQVQIPFALLKLIHWIFNQKSPEADTFLWDGSYELPTLYLDLQITTLSCVPSEDLFKSVLMSFNTLVRS